MTRYYLFCLDDATFNAYIDAVKVDAYGIVGYGIFGDANSWDAATNAAEIRDYNEMSAS